MPARVPAILPAARNEKNPETARQGDGPGGRDAQSGYCDRVDWQGRPACGIGVCREPAAGAGAGQTETDQSAGSMAAARFFPQMETLACRLSENPSGRTSPSRYAGTYRGRWPKMRVK